MTFEEYLIKKRINTEAFAAEDPARYQAWGRMYAQMHPNSFYVAVKMVLNNVRLRYHLREEDVPKPATTAAPRPVARRAASPAPKPEAESPAAIPAAPVVSQETTEEKPVIPAAVPKPRPVVRRPAALQAPPAEDVAPAPAKPAEEAAKPAVPRARPVIKRPAALAKPDDQPISEGQKEQAIPDQAAEASADTTKPTRPRPVIKRPAALQKPLQGEEQPDPKMPSEGIAAAGEAAPEASKPPRPRPVIKRPAALQKPSAEQQPVSSAEDKPVATDATPAGIASPVQPVSEETPKPPRPRPVIRRPTVLSRPATPEEKPEEVKPVEGEVAIPGAAAEISSEKESLSGASGVGIPPVVPAAGVEQSKETPLGNLPQTEPNAAPSAKPPRPRPIIKRPAPPEAGAPTPEADAKESQESSAAMGKVEETSAEVPPIPENPTEQPKPPRPRPIIRRPPPKTEQ